MLIKYIRVYQLSGAPTNVVGQTNGNSNLTGAEGPGMTPDNSGTEGLGDFMDLVWGFFGLFVLAEIGLVVLY